MFVILTISIYATSSCPPSWEGDTTCEDGQIADNQGVNDSDVQLGSLDIVSVSASPSRPEPGEEVKITVKVKNNADEKIEDILVEIEVEDLDDDKSFDLSAGKTKTTTFRFNMPYDVGDEDSSSIIVEVIGYGKDTSEEYTASDDSKEVTFNKKSHDLLIRDLEISPNKISCQDSFSIDYDIINIGNDDEEVVISIYNDKLGIDYSQTVEIDEEESYDDSVRLDAKIIEGVYDIEFVAKYGSRKETENVQLTIEECGKKSSSSEKKSSLKDKKTEQVEEDEKPVIAYVGSKEIVSATQGVPAIAAKTVKHSRVDFLGAEEYTFLLTILFIILFGLVIYAIGATIIILNK